MKKLSLFLSAMLISLMSFAGTVTFDATVDKTEVTNATEGTLTKDGVSLHTSMGVLGNGKEYRIYKNQSMDISCEYGNITAVEFTCTKEGTTQYGPGCLEYRGTAGTYTYEGFVGTWTGNEEKVTLYGALNQVRATKIVVTYESSDANFVSQPMITGDVNFADTANVVITADEGMKIYYTLDGTDPTTASTEYTSPFEVYATTTVKAIAYNEATATSSLVTTTVFTQATKIPCAEAAAIALTVSANNALTDLVYNVKGYVTKIASDYNSPVVGKQLFWIADTKTGGEVLYSYNNQVPCAMEVGMKVRIVGKLTKWNTGQYIQPQIVNAEITVLAPAPKVYTVSASAENGTVEGVGQYEEGAQATLTATAAEGYEFVNWTVDGTEISTENPYTFNVTADVALVANFKEAAAVTTKKETSTCPAGTLVDGKVIHELECCTIVQEKGEATKDLKAASPWVLPNKSLMTITPKAGVSIEKFIITCSNTTLGNMLRKSTVTNATAVGSNNPVEYHVTNPTEPVVFTLAGADENKVKQIDFTYTIAGATTDPEPVKYTVTVKAENGTVEGAGEYIENAEATLTATPAEGYEFVNWTVDGTEVSTENPYTFNVTADVEVVANFKETVVQTTKEEKSACPAGTLVDGKVIHDLESCTIVQEQGTATSALTAKSPWAAPAGSLMTITPKEGVTLQQLVVNTGNTTYATWFSSATLTNATMTKSNNIFTITVTDGTAPVVINFVKASQFKELTITYTVAGSTEPEPAKYTVTVKAENGTVEGAGEYEEGAEATLTATANEGYEFTCWTVGVDTVSTKNPYKFNVTADVEVVANFKEAAPVTETVYFINAKKWAKVNVYAWTTDPNASWPGAAATKEAEQIAGYDVYSFTANAGQYANVIFNDGSSQTPDLVWTAGKYYVIDMGWLTKEEAETKLAAPLPETWNIVGDAGLMGKGWDLNAAENAMTLQADGTYLLEKKGITIVAGSYEYKAAKDHGWTVAVPQDGNQKLTISKSGIYDVTFVLDVTAKKLTATATLKQAAVVIPTIVIAGDMNSWNQTKDKFTMSADSLTATFKATLAVKNYGFKMIVGGAWHSDGKTVTRDANSTKFTGANSNTNSTLKADIAGEYLFTWEYATKTLTVTYPALPVKYNVTVTAENGTVTGAGEYEEGKTATLTATPAEGYNFLNWTVGDSIVSTENPYSFVVTADIALVANFEKIPATKYNVTVTAENGTVTGAGEYEEGAEATLTATAAEGYNFVNWTVADSIVSTENPYSFVVTADVALVANFEKTEPEIWTVAGAPASIFGTEWDPANTANNMTLQADGTYKWEKTDLTLAASHIQFKIAKNNKWDEAYPTDNYDLAINEAGIYTITIIFNAASKEVTATATKTGDATVIPTIAIAGDMNGWNTTANEFVVSADELTATLTLNLEAKEYGFKMIVAGNWTSDGAKVTRENNTIVLTGANGENSTLVADVAGEYTFTWTYATSTLVVTYPVASSLENAIVAEQPVKIVRNGQVFILKGDKMFNTMGQQVK